MAYIFEPDVVKYGCTCGLLKPISKLYFCRHCLEIRCGFCVCHEVDSHFCGKCLENLPSTEARIKKNKCGNCVDCPSCQHQLSTRATTVRSTNTDDPRATPRKVVYLLCLLCRWSSRDVGIPDQPSSNSSWPERENIHSNRLHEIQDFYKKMVSLEMQLKIDKDKKKQRKFMSYTDRTGITASMLRRRIGLPDIPNPLLKPKPEEPKPSNAHAEVDELPAELLTKPIKLVDITTIEQRLMLPDWQPASVDKLYPVHRQLAVKRSLRCRSCEHNVSKPEYNPNSIKFKIQLFAFYHLPEIRILTVEPLRAGKLCELLIKFINPTQHQTVITLLALEVMDEEVTLTETEEQTSEETSIQLEKEKEPALISQPSSLIHTSLARQPSITVKPRQVEQLANANIGIPESSFVLPPRDDAAEYDDTGDHHNIQDDPKLVVFRKSNKAVIRLCITPNDDLNLGDEVMVGFTMQHLYTNTIATTIDNKEPQKYEHKMKVFLSLGKLVGSE